MRRWMLALGFLLLGAAVVVLFAIREQEGEFKSRRPGGSVGPVEPPEARATDRDAPAEDASEGPRLTGSGSTGAPGNDKAERDELFGVGRVTFGLFPPPSPRLGEVLRSEPWRLAEAHGEPSNASRQSPNVVWTYPASMSGPHFLVSIDRTVDGPYDGRVLRPDSVTILEREAVDQGLYIETVPAADAMSHGEGTRIQADGQTWSVIGSIEDWGTTASDFSAFRVRGLERTDLPLTVTVWVKYDARERTQRLRFTRPLDRLVLRRVAAEPRDKLSHIAFRCTVNYMEGIGRAYVEMQDSRAAFYPSQTLLDGQPLIHPTRKTVTGARLEILGEYNGVIDSIRARLWVEDIHGARHGIALESPD